MPDLVAPPTVERFRRVGVAAWSIIGVLILLSTALWVLLLVHEIFPPLIVALVTIYVMNPFVTRMETVGINRLLGSCLSYFVLMGIVALAIVLLTPVLIDQGQAFARDFPQTVDRVGELGQSVSEQLQRRFGARVDIGEWIGGRQDLAESILGGVGGFLRSAVETTALLVIGLVLGFYLLVDLPRLRRSTLRLIPPDRRSESQEVAGAVGSAMGGFFRGQLLVAFIVAVMSSLGLWMIGLPYWAVVGVIAGFFNLVPLIGPFVGAVPAIIIALALKPPITALWVIVVLTIVQQIDNHFISPNVMRWSVNLHPVTVMISLTAGAALAGFFGMLVAVPIVAASKVVASHLWKTRVPWGEDAFEEASPERGPPHLEASKTTPDRPAVLGEPRPAVLPEPPGEPD